ncbi:Oidioi.mRNA.OKI2018_I69.XSR.g15378.t1.cds [Oikopleura dioica]|uniref:Oidioi.mRNA.OKI2018_I69.XSR.g15378.t1.cds n=1 Tax=Oikopleura dioica TaxID=34765 RepID=A0ABN7SHR9_OIKDI|nr:Oidioi.mRNA.OKI2018_I69.XSR.g15378.t1.cds [Oikopleura dioica]
MREFTINLHPNQREEVIVHAGWVVDGLKFGNEKNQGPKQSIGGNGGTRRVFHLGPKESIGRVWGNRIMFEGHKVIGQITFQTTNGTVHGPFGSNGNPRGDPIGIIETFDFCSSPGQAMTAQVGSRAGPGLKKITGSCSNKFIFAMNFHFQE